MPHTPKYLYKIHDFADRVWNVRFERPTAHGWLLLLGRPANPGDEEKNCYGGDQVIITHELANYMEAMRMVPREIDLPVCIATVTRIRRVLCQNFNADRAKWWDEHKYDLTSEQKDFAVTYEVCPSTVARHSKLRGIIHGSQKWSKEDKSLLLRLLKKQLSVEEIATQMGRSKGAIKVMRRRLIGNISKTRPWSAEEKAEALRLLADGVKAKEIATRMGRTKISLFTMRGRAIGPISKTKESWNDEEKTRLVQMVRSGHDDQQIAAILQRSKFAVRNMRQRLLPDVRRRGKSAPTSATNRQC